MAVGIGCRRSGDETVENDSTPTITVVSRQPRYELRVTNCGMPSTSLIIAE